MKTMGCSAAKNMAVAETNGQVEVDMPKFVQRNIPPEEIIPKTEMLQSEKISNVQKTQHGMSFEIEFDDKDETDSLIRKHPPRRLHKLEDHRIEPTETLEKLQEKLEEAEVRRQQIIQQRIQSAKFRANLKKQSSIASLPEEDQGHCLRVPDNGRLDAMHVAQTIRA